MLECRFPTWLILGIKLRMGVWQQYCSQGNGEWDAVVNGEFKGTSKPVTVDYNVLERTDTPDLFAYGGFCFPSSSCIWTCHGYIFVICWLTLAICSMQAWYFQPWPRNPSRWCWRIQYPGPRSVEILAKVIRWTEFPLKFTAVLTCPVL